MNNLFIATPPFNTKRIPSVIGLVNKTIKRIGYNYALKPLLDPFRDMNSIEQRNNYYLLIDSIIANNIEGEMVEMGCFTGHCAMLFQKTIEERHSNKQLHLYDSFEKKFAVTGSVEDELKENFKNAALKLPIIHKGVFEQTVPQELPDKISFAHIDCGWGGDKMIHKNIVLFCLEHIYPQMTKGAICVLMDYYDESVTPAGIGLNANPGVKLACDDFLENKPEEMIYIYSNDCSHGFFRKNK
jgi:O-methyltransferase